NRSLDRGLTMDRISWTAAGPNVTLSRTGQEGPYLTGHAIPITPPIILADWTEARSITFTRGPRVGNGAWLVLVTNEERYLETLVRDWSPDTVLGAQSALVRDLLSRRQRLGMGRLVTLDETDWRTDLARAKARSPEWFARTLVTTTLA